MSESEPPPYAAGEEATADPRKRRKLRLWVAMAAGVLGILCLGGVGVAVLLYDEETKIERVEPDAVLDNFLGAYLVNRDDKEADLYLCESPDLAGISAFRNDVASRESTFTVGITVSWGSMQVTVNGDRATVITDLTKATSTGNERVTKPWRFDLENRDGWRVCGAGEVAS